MNILLASLISLMNAAPAWAQERELSSQVMDPSAPLKTITIVDKFAASVWGPEGESNRAELQTNVPSNAFGYPNIFRLTVPVTRAGVEEAQALDLIVTKLPAGRLLLGFSVGLSRTMTAGPAVGFVTDRGKWTLGVLAQTFSGEGPDRTSLQPVVAYAVNKNLSLGYGDDPFLVDWELGRSTTVPLSFQLNYIYTAGKQPVRLFVTPMYNVRKYPGTPMWQLGVGLSLLLI